MTKPLAQPATIPEHQADPAAHPKVVQTIAASGAAQTLDLSAYDSFNITLTANCTLAFSNPPSAGDIHAIKLRFLQDAVGSRTVTFPASAKWSGGTGPTITAASGSVDVATLETWDGGTTYMSSIVQNVK